MKSRALSILLTMCLTVGFIPSAAWAEASDAADQASGAASSTTSQEGSNEETQPSDSQTTTVATIDGVAYETVQAALERGGHVVLTSDVAENVTVPAGITAELDLNGHTLNGGTAAGKAAIANNGELTVTNGTVMRDDAGQAGYYVIDNEGTMTLGQGATVENDANGSSVLCNGLKADATLTVQEGATISATQWIALINYSQGTLEITGGEVKNEAAEYAALLNWGSATVSGGTLTGTNAVQGATDPQTNSSALTINGGTIVGQVVSYREKGNGVNNPAITINGGTFKGDFKVSGSSATGTTSSDRFNITGGSFSSDVIQYVSGDNACVKGEDGSYTVAKCTAENADAQAGDLYFQTLHNALAYAPTGSTVTVLRDCTVATTAVVAKDVELTVDLNGKTLTAMVPKASAFRTIAGSSLTLRDSSPEAAGGVVSSGNGQDLIDAYGDVTIENGTFDAGSACAVKICNANANVAINGGTFSSTGSNGAVWAAYGKTTINEAVVSSVNVGTTGTLVLNGGKFKGSLKVYKGGVLTIAGGMFAVDPSAYLAEGKSAQLISEDGYVAKVVSAEELKTVEPEVAVAPAQAEVADTIAPEAKEAAEEVAKTLVSNDAEAPALKVSDEAMANAAQAEALPVDQAIVVNGEVTSPLAELQKVDGLSDVSAEDVAVVRQAFLQATVNDVKVEDGAVKEFTVDIQPMVKTFVTTKESASAGTIEEGTNAVALGETQKITVAEPTTVTIPLVSSFAESETTLFVKHNHEGKIFFYHAAVQDNNGVRTASFNNPNGFSEFTISTTNPAAVEIGEGENTVGYASLEEAITAAESGSTITVLDAEAVKGTTVIFSEAKSFSLVDSEGNPFTDIVFAAAKGYYVTDTPEGTFETVKKTDLKDAEVTLGTDSMAYTGHAWKPEVTVAMGEQQLVEGTDYKVSYDNNVEVGQATLTVSGLGAYFGTVDKTFEITKADQSIQVSKAAYAKTYGDASFSTGLKGAKTSYTCTTNNAKVATVSSTGMVYVKGVGAATLTFIAKGDANYNASAPVTVTVTVNPKAVNLSKVKAGKKSFKASWKKSSSANATGYQVRYSTSKKMSGAKTKTVKGYKSASKTIKGLKAGKKYYVQLRAFKSVSGKTYYSSWSTAKTVKTKK